MLFERSTRIEEISMFSELPLLGAFRHSVEHKRSQQTIPANYAENQKTPGPSICRKPALRELTERVRKLKKDRKPTHLAEFTEIQFESVEEDEVNMSKLSNITEETDMPGSETTIIQFDTANQNKGERSFVEPPRKEQRNLLRTKRFIDEHHQISCR